MGYEPPKNIKSFEEFWPHYVQAHASPRNRAVHVVGTLGAIIFVLLAPVFHYLPYLILLPVVIYGPLWMGHFLFEGNKPATLLYPLWSMRGDLRMCWRILTGQRLS